MKFQEGKHKNLENQEVYNLNLAKKHSVAFEAVIEASKLVKEIFETGKINTQLKEDHSPVTNADLESSKIIIEKLLETGIPVLCEEDENNEYDKRKDWKAMWVVDPLDGTWGFINGKEEFVINVGLVENGKPVFGIIAVPMAQEVYFGGKDFGAYRFNFKTGTVGQATKLPLYATPNNELIVTGGEETPVSFYGNSPFIDKKYESTSFVKVASALKFCLIAEGRMDIYPRNYPCMEWDTAAGHAIINGIGKELYDVETNEVIGYNREDLHVPFFVLT